MSHDVETPERRTAEEKRALLARLLEARAHQPRRAPLAFAQERLWFLEQLHPGLAAYHLSVAISLEGRLDPAALQAALDGLVKRHAVLRTCFALDAGQPVQLIMPADQAAAPRLQVSDARHWPAEARAAELQRYAAALAAKPFDLANGPLLRADLLELGDTEHILALTLHHIIADGWSIGVLVDDLAALYRAAVEGRPAQMPDLPAQYADYARWQRHTLQGEALEHLLAYWRAQLGGRLPTLELPADRPRPPLPSYRGARLAHPLPPELTAALRALGAREKVTLFVVLLAAFQVLLACYTGQDDLIVGSPVTNRSRSELERLVGLLVSTVVLRTDLAGDPTVGELLGRVRATVAGAFAHQDAPFEKLVEELRPPRDTSRSPLFQIFFALQNAPTPLIELPGLALRPIPIDRRAAQFDLALHIVEQPDQLVAQFEYATDLFDQATIARMAGHYQTLLEGITANPDGRVSALPLLTPAERAQILGEWNATAADYPRERGLHDLVAAQAARTPDSIALMFDHPFDAAQDRRPPTGRGGEGERGRGGDNGQPTHITFHVSRFTQQPSQFSILNSQFSYLTYAELNERANQLAHHLRSLGVGPETLVGVCMERSPEQMIALLGILKAGGAYLPLDPHFPAERLRYMLDDALVSVVLTAERGRGGEGETAQATLLPLSPSVIDLIADWDHISQHPATNPDSGVMPENLAYVIYTSGSTGRPKGVQIPHRAVVNFMHSMRRRPGMSADDRLLSVTTLSFDIAALELFLPLTVGGQVALVSREDTLDGARLGAALERFGVTVMQATPATWRLLIASGWAGRQNLRALCGGEALPPDLAGQLHERCAKVWNMYGPTETTIWSTVAQVQPGEQPISIGRPIANTLIAILDRAGHPTPVGIPGELLIGGEGLARGYLGRPELTAERFIPNPFAENKEQRTKNKELTGRGGEGERGSGGESTPGVFHPPSSILHPPSSRLYRTGDLARYRPDGTIECLGRLDHQIKLRGYRIELGEIETLLAQHGAVRQAVVLVREDVPGAKQLVAYIVPGQEPRTKNQEQKSETPDSQFSILNSQFLGELRAYLRQHLPDYMLPSVFVTLNALPLTPNGKIDRQALPSPERGRDALETAYLAPQTELEQTIASVWQEALQVERVGLNDNFFDLGGHSLLLIQAHTALRQRLGRELTVLELFQYPTVGALADHLRCGAEAAAPKQRGAEIRAGQNRLLQQRQQRQSRERP